jgi:hypothetical protein
MEFRAGKLAQSLHKSHLSSQACAKAVANDSRRAERVGRSIFVFASFQRKSRFPFGAECYQEDG